MELKEYKPGFCNIGDEEVQGRKKMFYFTALLTLLIIIYNLVNRPGFTGLFILFSMAVVTAVFYLQFKNRFCIRYGLLKQFNFGKKGSAENVINNEFIKQDRKKALQTIIKALLFGFLVTVIVYVINS